jgi:hypothetical protein
LVLDILFYLSQFSLPIGELKVGELKDEIEEILESLAYIFTI